MSARCDGSCCKRFSIFDMNGRAESHAEIRARALRWQSADTMTLFAVLRPDGIDDGKQRFRCAALGESGCTLPRESRPHMCNAHPYESGCWRCGARSDMEARGVALEHLPGRGLSC